MWVSGSYDPPGQFVPPFGYPRISVPTGPSGLLTTGGVKTGPDLYLDAILSASARSSGVKSIRSSAEKPLRPKKGGLVGMGCVAEYHSPGVFPWGTGRSTIGQMGSPVSRFSTY